MRCCLFGTAAWHGVQLYGHHVPGHYKVHQTAFIKCKNATFSMVHYFERVVRF